MYLYFNSIYTCVYILHYFALKKGIYIQIKFQKHSCTNLILPVHSVVQQNIARKNLKNVFPFSGFVGNEAVLVRFVCSTLLIHSP